MEKTIQLVNGDLGLQIDTYQMFDSESDELNEINDSIEMYG